MAQVAAEKANPKYDVWYAGTGDPHLQAAELGLAEEYKSPMLGELCDWSVRQAEQSKFRTVGIYTGALGIGYNSELLAKKIVVPCQGTGYEVGSMSVIKGARNLDPYDFAKYGSATERKRILEKWDKNVYALPR